MKLTDVMSGAGLAVYAEIAMLIFLAVFLAVAFHLLFAKRAAFERAARMPLDDDTPAPPSTTDAAQ